MTAEQIRLLPVTGLEANRNTILREIAAQLAEQNERAARQEPLALRIAEKSLAMMERTEKGLDELDGKRKASHGSSQS